MAEGKGRKMTRVVHIKDLAIGGGNRVMIQSMTNTRTEDVTATVAQIKRLTASGCEMVRCTVPTMEAISVHQNASKQLWKRQRNVVSQFG